ncbi:envelope-like protein, partial [Trifolium medium]|nr:envelope-like protein [Trifolium medium]
HLECELLLDDRLVHLPDCSQGSTKPAVADSSKPSNQGSPMPSKNTKRKAASSNDPDFEEDITTTEAVSTGQASRKSIKGRKVPANVPPAPLDNISFHHESWVLRWRFVYNRRLSVERNLSKNALKREEIVKLINVAGLIKTVTDLGKCYERLVKEFLVNISEECDNVKSLEFQQVYVRGRCVYFSPLIINGCLGRSNEKAEMKVSMDEICRTITGNSVTTWPKKTALSSARLTAKYAALNKIAAVNRVPTCTPTAYPQTLLHGKSLAVKMPIAFPTLLCNIILGQHPDILTATDEESPRQSDLCLDYRLFEGTHAADIAGASGSKSSGTLSKQHMIDELKESSKALAERKEAIDRVIAALEAEVAKE